MGIRNGVDWDSPIIFGAEVIVDRLIAPGICLERARLTIIVTIEASGRESLDRNA